MLITLLLLPVLLPLALVYGAVIHECAPFTKTGSSQSQFWLQTTRNASILIYNQPLTLISNIPYKVDDSPIHFYSSHDDFTVCGVDQFRGSYCNEFAHFTVRTTKSGKSDNVTVDSYSWQDTFEQKKYGHMIAANEFVLFDHGKMNWTIPYDGVWCIVMYQDGHYLNNVEIGWKQAWGEVSLYDWRSWTSTLVWGGVSFVALCLVTFLGGRKSDKNRSMTGLFITLYCLVKWITFKIMNGDVHIASSSLRVSLLVLLGFISVLLEFKASTYILMIIFKTGRLSRSMVYLCLIHAISGVSNTTAFEYLRLSATVLILCSFYNPRTGVQPTSGSLLAYIVLCMYLLQALLPTYFFLITLPNVSMKERTWLQRAVVVTQEASAQGPEWLYVLVDVLTSVLITGAIYITD